MSPKVDGGSHLHSLKDITHHRSVAFSHSFMSHPAVSYLPPTLHPEEPSQKKCHTTYCTSSKCNSEHVAGRSSGEEHMS